MKVLIVGAPKVGKTSIVKRYVRNTWSDTATVTLGVDFALKKLGPEQFEGTQPPVKGPVKLQVWDIAGQEYQSSMVRSYYIGAHAAFVVADGTDPFSFEVAKNWKRELDDKFRPSSRSSQDVSEAILSTLSEASRKIPTYLLVSKSDLQFTLETAAPSAEGATPDLAAVQTWLQSGSWMPSDVNMASDDAMRASAADGGQREQTRSSSAPEIIRQARTWVPREVVEQVCQQAGFDGYFLVSAKTGDGVDEAFIAMAKSVVETFPSLFEDAPQNAFDRKARRPPPAPREKTCSC